MLILSRKAGESIVISDNIEVSVVDIKGDQVKIGIEAPEHIKIYRLEVYRAIQEENRAAAQSNIQIPLIDGLFDGDEDT